MLATIGTSLPRTLLAALRQGRLAHAYIFSGPAERAFEQAALTLAQHLNCPAQDPAGAPCLRCSACLRLAAGAHPDLHVLKPEGAHLGIDEVRRLLRDLTMTVVEGPWRVFLILQAQRLTLEAANRMLKLLEEPPAQTVILLATAAVEELPATIRSRCQEIKFGLPPEEDVVAALTEMDATQAPPGDDASGPPEAPPNLLTARYLVRLAGGREDLARELFAAGAAGELRQDVVTIAGQLLADDPLAPLQAGQSLAADADSLPTKLLILEALWRDLSLLSAGAAADHLYHGDIVPQLEALRQQGFPVGDHGTLEELLQVSARLRAALAVHGGRQLACDAACLRMAAILGRART